MLAESGDNVVCIALLSKARQKLEPEHFEGFKGELAKIRLGDGDRKMIRESGIALAKKYTFLLKWGPEVILLVCAAQYSLRMGNVLRHLNSMPDIKRTETPISAEQKKPA